MTFIAISNKPVAAGALPGIDMTPFVLNADTLFQNHKARVIADGGFIPDEAATLSEFNFIVNNGFYSRAVAWPSVDGGIKRNETTGDVLKVYSLIGPDFIPVTVAGSASPLPTIKVDTTGARRGVSILLSNGGTYLRSESVVKVQAKANTQWLMAARMRDLNLTDNAGIAVGWGTPTSTYAYIETRVTGSVSNPWKYVATNSIPVVANSLIAATQTPYSDFVKSAGLFDPATGKVMGYQEGKLARLGVSDTSKLADFSGTSQYLWIGTTNLAQAGSLNVCHGTFANLRCLSQATENDAILISNRA
ncbi:hypothetical protein MNO11_15270 [Serratia plymuthica]|uniref:hypothetical protein n=1 Tax=Serratia plymuthica TaxID=82996 RepID=UPI001F534AA5|nr:hypothetical protein [Serratia plymuthica]UNK26205.1 hypothetical protein MNO11_15270 [Serratia plymuthica]